MRNYIFFLCMLPILLSCTAEFDQATFESERRLWTKQGFQNYSFRQSYDSNIGNFAEVTPIIKDGKLCYIRQLERNGAEAKLYLPGLYKKIYNYPCFAMPIPEIFAMIEEIAKDKHGIGRVTITTEYDENFHYPKYVWYNHGVSSAIYVDGAGSSWSVTITDLILDPVVPEETSFSFNRETFTEGRQKWAAGNNRDYTFYILVTYASEDKNRTYNSWGGQVVVRDGDVHKILGAETTDQPGETVRDWVTSIDGIFAKVEDEAEKYADEPGVHIRFDYDDNRLDQDIRMSIYLLRISPESPDESFSYEVYTYAFNQPAWWL